MTLLTEKIGDGPTRRCDARCYTGKHDKCACICGGKNHGAGLEKAVDNVRETFLPMIEAKTGMQLGKMLRQGKLALEAGK